LIEYSSTIACWKVGQHARVWCTKFKLHIIIDQSVIDDRLSWSRVMNEELILMRLKSVPLELHLDWMSKAASMAIFVYYKVGSIKNWTFFIPLYMVSWHVLSTTRMDLMLSRLPDGYYALWKDKLMLMICLSKRE